MNATLKKSNTGQFKIPMVVFTLALFVSSSIVWVSEVARTEQLRNTLKVLATHQATTLQRKLDNALSSTYALAAMVRQVHGDLPNFQALAHEMMPFYDGASTLALAPNGIVSQIYPLEANKKAIGHNLMKDPLRDKEAILARNSGKLTLAGPFDLVQGGIAAAGRYPVFFSKTDSPPKFWGLVTVLVRFPEILKNTGITDLVNSGYEYELWRVHPDSGERHVIDASRNTTQAVFDIERAVSVTLDVPNATWTLSVTPQRSLNSFTLIAAKTFLAFFVSLGLAVLAWMLVQLRSKNKELDQHRSNLQYLVDERTHELSQATEKMREAKDQAEKMSRVKTDFLANISHEIRTPLNGLLGVAQVLERTVIDVGQREMVLQIRHAGKVLLRLLNDVLDFSKIESGKMTLESVPFNTSDLVADLNGLMAGAAQAKGLSLAVILSSEVKCNFMGDSRYLLQILSNLVGNAIKFTDRGDITVNIFALSKNETHKQVRFEIVDSGIGIPADKQVQLFQPFMQVDSSMTRRFGGTGLGLSICKELVSLMGGVIGVESKPGQGSLFWFELNLLLSEKIPTPIKDNLLVVENMQPRLMGLQFLVVDDSEMNRVTLERMMRIEGAIVTHAKNGQEAIDLLKISSNNFDAVLMDIQMPVMDGLEATRLIRLELNLKDLPVLVCSAGVQITEQANALACGANEFIQKPIDLELLVAMLLRGAVTREPANDVQKIFKTALPLIKDWPEIKGIDAVYAKKQFRGDRDFFEMLLTLLLEELQQMACDVSEDFRLDAQVDAKKLHKLRGSAGAVGAHGLVEACRALELAIKEGSPDLAKCRQQFIDEIELLRHGLKLNRLTQ